MKKRIVQIVGVPGGVSDFAHCLATSWSGAGFESTVVSVFDGRFADRRVFKQIAASARDNADVIAVIVHFSGYGYAHRGLCFWLVNELRALGRDIPAHIPRILVYHELFAGGPVWSSAFWLQPLQRTIAKQLARSADLVWTNTEGHRLWLQARVRPGTQVHRYPVFSNLGAPQAGLPAFADRADTAIVFGSEGTRRRFFLKIQDRLPSTELFQGLRVVEIGPGKAMASACGIASEFPGILPAEEASRLLSGSRYGFLEYPGQYLAKSSVMAAYAAHGMLVCNAAHEIRPADGLQVGTHYVSVDTFDPRRVADNALVGRNLEHWYAGHRLEGQAAEMLRLIVQWPLAGTGPA